MALTNRLKKNFKHLSKWARRQGIEAWRLYDRDIPEYPYMIDIYQDYAVIHLRLSKIDQEEEKKKNLKELHDALEALGFLPQNRIIKRRAPQKSDQRYQKLGAEGIIKTVSEGDLHFEVNLSDYLDTGLFLDHRPLRQNLARENLKGLKALNLFCYTGSLSVAMAKAGAHVTSADLNPKYLDWAKKNFKLNNLSPNDHQWIEGDCLNLLKELEPFSYDIIVLDPPSFSTSKKFRGTLDVQRDHPFLLKACHGLLKEGGTGYFSTNLRSFKMEDPLIKELGLKETSHKTIPEDFHDKKIHRSFTWKKN